MGSDANPSTATGRSRYTVEQFSALSSLVDEHGEPHYVNDFRPERAAYADWYGPVLMVRITPDGDIQDVTAAMLADPY